MKDGTATPWAVQKVNCLLTLMFLLAPAPLLDAFIDELQAVFGDPNHEASARQKLSKVHQGNNPIDAVIQLFELYGLPSQLGDAGLINKFEQAISYRLCQAIYTLFPLPETWEEWKQRASILDNQLRHFDYMQAQIHHGQQGTDMMNAGCLQSQCSALTPISTQRMTPPHLHPHPPPSSQNLSDSQPMELDHTNQPCRIV